VELVCFVTSLASLFSYMYFSLSLDCLDAIMLFGEFCYFVISYSAKCFCISVYGGVFFDH